jgi:hypothetical protein
MLPESHDYSASTVLQGRLINSYPRVDLANLRKAKVEVKHCNHINTVGSQIKHSIRQSAVLAIYRDYRY